MPIYTFKCAANHETDAIVAFDTKSTKCSICGKTAKRTSAPQLPARRDPNHGIQR